MEVTVIDVLKQMEVAIPSILVGTQVITAAIHGAFKIEDKNLVHAISWIIATLAGLGFVAFNGLDFGLPTVWNYVVGGICGLIVGGTANGWFDWPWIEKIFNAVTRLFSGGK
jgi:hypothetical protein